MSTYTYTSPVDGSVYDTYIDTYLGGNNNYNTSIYIQLGEIHRDPEVDITGRGIIKFPGLKDGSIPSGARVSSCSLFVKKRFIESANTRTMRIYRLKRDVVYDQTTWYLWKSGSYWSSAGGFGSDDCEQTDIGSCTFVLGEADVWKEFVMNPAKVQEIIDGTWSLSSWLIKADVESNDATNVYSSNDAEANRPYIVIGYELEVGNTMCLG